MNYEEKDYLKDRKRYGFLASLPIIVAIFHLLFAVIFMTIVNFHPEDNTFSNLYVLGELFASSSFSAFLVAGQNSLQAMKTVPSIVAVVLGLGLIFLSTGAVKGKKKLYFISFLIYVFDTIMMIPAIIINLVVKSSVYYRVYDYILMILIHIVFLAIFVWGLFICKRLDAYEEKKIQEENTIHIHKGNSL